MVVLIYTFTFVTTVVDACCKAGIFCGTCTFTLSEFLLIFSNMLWVANPPSSSRMMISL